ncbi:MAG: hypothetical protein LBO00_07680, partial [Zoogloeaceae bacterium]|nr:hypothetical protein [Zoogloeaceae bacterium]
EETPVTSTGTGAQNAGRSATIHIHSSPAPTTPMGRKQGGYIILNHGPHAKPRPKANNSESAPTPLIDWNAKVPNWEVEKTPQWILEAFEQFKEKPKTLAELTGLVFPMEGKE